MASRVRGSHVANFAHQLEPGGVTGSSLPTPFAVLLQHFQRCVPPECCRVFLRADNSLTNRLHAGPACRAGSVGRDMAAGQACGGPSCAARVPRGGAQGTPGAAQQHCPCARAPRAVSCIPRCVPKTETTPSLSLSCVTQHRRCERSYLSRLHLHHV